MKVLIVAPADESRRFKHELPPKGSQFLRRPNYDLLRLVPLILPLAEIVYIDEQVEELDLDKAYDLVLIYTDLGLETRGLEITTAFQRRGRQIIVFGPMATIMPQIMSHKANSVVVGDINNIWSVLWADFLAGELKRLYVADKSPHHTLPAWEFGRKVGFDKRFQAMQAVLGCFCPESVKHLCPQYLYYGRNFYIRPLLEVIGEVVSLPYKQVFLRDDDVAHNPDYYCELFNRIWTYRKEWFIQAGSGIFNSPELLKLLSKAGVRVIFLNEGWFTEDEIYEACHNRATFLRRHRQVQLLHSLKMVVGARILLTYREEPIDFHAVSGFFYRLGIDILELKVFAPVLERDRFSIKEILFWPEVLPPTHFPTGFLWLKDQFYSFNSIFGRAARVLTKVGIYNTFRYFFLINLAYRQNFLEGIPYPP